MVTVLLLCDKRPGRVQNQGLLTLLLDGRNDLSSSATHYRIDNFGDNFSNIFSNIFSYIFSYIFSDTCSCK